MENEVRSKIFLCVFVVMGTSIYEGAETLFEGDIVVICQFVQERKYVLRKGNLIILLLPISVCFPDYHAEYLCKCITKKIGLKLLHSFTQHIAFLLHQEMKFLCAYLQHPEAE
ncbi:hypothetical protein M5689_003784 [Euphorbia peplus]|nr:hypothetical protein M5689_003784 [Euphorbia peplus]